MDYHELLKEEKKLEEEARQILDEHIQQWLSARDLWNKYKEVCNEVRWVRYRIGKVKAQTCGLFRRTGAPQVVECARRDERITRYTLYVEYCKYCQFDPTDSESVTHFRAEVALEKLSK